MQDTLLVQSLGPSTDQTHAKGAEQDQQAGKDTLLAAQVAPAGVAEKVLGEELDQGGKGQQASRDGIHDADEDEADLGVGAIERVRGESDGLTDGGTRWELDSLFRIFCMIGMERGIEL